MASKNIRKAPSVEEYVDEDNIKKRISTKINVKGGNIVADDLPYKFKLSKKDIGFEYISKKGGIVSMVLDWNSAIPEPVVSGNRITYDCGDFDIIFILKPFYVKSIRILKNDNAPKQYRWIVTSDNDGKSKIVNDIVGWDNQRRWIEINSTVNEIEVKPNETIYEFIEEWTGRVSVRDPEKRIMSYIDGGEYPITIDPIISEGQEFASGMTGTELKYYPGSSSWSFSSYFMTINYGYTQKRIPGMRFSGIDIPQGSIINSATLGFYVGLPPFVYYYMDFDIFGIDVDDSEAWLDGVVVPSMLDKTTANYFVDVTTSGFFEYDVTDIVQEIVNRSGWVSGNSMSFVCMAAVSGGAYGTRISYRGANDDIVLEIDYTESESGAIKTTRIMLSSILNIDGGLLLGPNL